MSSSATPKAAGPGAGLSPGNDDRGASPRGMSGSRAPWLFGLAIALTVAAMLKPILWDDEVYFQFARYIAQHPFDPYAVRIWVNGHSLDGLYVLAPPVLLYWWGGAIALFGPNVGVSAIAMFPFAAAYTISFHNLARRFAPELALPLTVMATVSPWALVTTSYMLDFPAVALGLASLSLFVAGADRGTRHWVVAAGLLAGFALETKYNAIAAVGAILLWGLFARRLLDGMLAAAVSALVFCAIETLIALKYGHSHFVLHAVESASSGIIHEISRLRELLYAFIENAGPLAIGISLILPVALGGRPRAIVAYTVFALAAFGLSAAGFDRILGSIIPGMTPDRMPMVLTASGLLGFTFLLSGAKLIGAASRRRILFEDREACFLLAWVVLEALIYFAMSPFPAARRMGEFTVVALLFAGRAAVLPVRSAATGRFLHVAVVINALCGLTMLAIALVDGWNVVTTARAAAAFMRANRQGGQDWQMTSLAFAHYFDAEGIDRVERDTTMLQPGDLLAIEPRDPEHMTLLEGAGLQPVATIRAGINLGVSVSTSFFRNQNPWFAASDTRPTVMVLRAGKPTGIPAAF